MREPVHQIHRRRRGEPEPPAEKVAGRDPLTLPRALGNQAFGRLLRQPVAPPAPLTDEQQWEADWNDPAFAKAQHYFEGPDRPVGNKKFRYDTLCPLYKAHGIKRPLKYVSENIVTATLYGHKSPAHQSLASAMATAETNLRTQGYADAPFRKMWAFNPRTQTGGQWSNHADGKAVDIDELTNPRLLGQHNRDVITALTGYDIEAKNPGAGRGMDSYDSAADASRIFQDLYSKEGMEDRVEGFESDELEIQELAKAQAEELAGLPTGKKATKEDVAKRKAAQAELKATQARLKSTIAKRKTLQAELKHFEALDAAVDKLETEIDELNGKIEKLQQEIDLLDSGVPVAGVKNPKAKIAADKKEIKATELTIKKRQKKLDDAIKAREGDTLRGYAQRGFLDLNKDLVEAMKAAGLRWGGDYEGVKDFMHFEVV